jgi:hypothetical protein
MKRFPFTNQLFRLLAVVKQILIPLGKTSEAVFLSVRTFSLEFKTK